MQFYYCSTANIFLSIVVFLVINFQSVDSFDKGCANCKGPKAFNSKIEKLN